MDFDREDSGALAAAAGARVASWLATLKTDPSDGGGVDVGEASARNDVLEGVRQASDGFDFTRRLLETVVGASDPFAAALNLREVSREVPDSMPALERFAVRVGGIASLGLPWAVLPVARRVLRNRLSRLVMLAPVHGRSAAQGTAAELAAALKQVSAPGQTVFALAGREVVGKRAARRELRRVLALLDQPETSGVAVDVSRLVPAGTAEMWALDRDAARGARRVRALLERAEDRGATVTLESSDYRGALLAPQMLVRALAGPGLERVRAGVTLPAELPESMQSAEALVQLSRARVSAGSEALEIGVGSGVTLSGEQINSIQSGLAVPSLENLTEQQAQLLRVLRLLLAAGDAVRTVVSSDDALLLAAATLLAEAEGRALTLQVRAGTVAEFEMAMREHGFAVRRRMPIAPPREFDGLLDYLVALAAESATPGSELDRSRATLAGEAGALEAAVQHLGEVIARSGHESPESRRVQHREHEWSETARDTSAFYRAPTEATHLDTGGLTAAVLALTRSHTGEIGFDLAGPALRLPVVSATGFANEPDTDASRFQNRSWVRSLLARAAQSDIGVDGAQAALTRAESTSELFDAALDAVGPWAAQRPAERGARVARLALGAASARDRLTEVLAAETGAAVPVIDRDINGVIDAARYLGQLAGGLGAVRGAAFQPDRLVLVVADASVPLAERAEATLAALAAGSAVVLIAHASVARSSAVLIDEWRAAGLPAGVLTLAVADDDHTLLAAQFASDPRLVRALVLGRRETAEAMLRRRPDLRVEGRFRAPGAVLITPSAEPEVAVRHTVASAFSCGHGDASAARVLVLLGTAARSLRLRRRLADAVRSLSVGDTARPGTSDPLTFEMGPLIDVPDEAGLRALTQLDPGEEWLVQPEQLDDDGRLWRPGVRLGVKRGARFWRDAIGMPVIGVIAASTIDEAISLVNTLGGGGVAGLHANDRTEMLPWLERARAAALTVGRATTGARIERQPYGGWGAAGMGIATLAGGPSRLLTLGSWQLREGTASSTLHLRGLKPEVRRLIETAQATLDYESFDRVRRAALADALAWRTQLGGVHDVSGLGIERNLLRRWPVNTHVRLAEGSGFAHLMRVVAAGFAAGAPLSVSTGVVLPAEISDYLAMQGVTVSLERDEAWLERLAVSGPSDDTLEVSRVRLIGGDRVRTAEWLGGLGEITLWAEPVTMAGPVELLAFLQEQSISVAAHRHGLALLPEGIGSWIAELQDEV